MHDELGLALWDDCYCTGIKLSITEDWNLEMVPHWTGMEIETQMGMTEDCYCSIQNQLIHCPMFYVLNTSR